jgi:hypothetical protein
MTIIDIYNNRQYTGKASRVRDMLWDVVWRSNAKSSKVTEVIEYAKPRALANYIKEQKETTTHKAGVVSLRRHK